MLWEKTLRGQYHVDIEIDSRFYTTPMLCVYFFKRSNSGYVADNVYRVPIDKKNKKILWKNKVVKKRYKY